jgi:GTPase SAR1 family protein
MVKCCQMVMGPAGVGKSTYCRAVQDWAAHNRRTIHVVSNHWLSLFDEHMQDTDSSLISVA